jgi:hypothetical protein
MSTFLEAQILDYIAGTDLEAPTLYFSLHTADPTDAGTPSTEVQLSAYPNYQRQAAPAENAWNPKSLAGGKTSMTNAYFYAFPQNLDGSNVTVTHVGMYDAATGGHLLARWQLVEPQLVRTNMAFLVPVGVLELQVDVSAE